MNVVADRIEAPAGSIIYNVIQKEIIVGPGDVLVGVFDSNGEQMLVRSTIETDGGIFLTFTHHRHVIVVEMSAV